MSAAADPATVSVIIPTAGRSEHLQDVVSAVLADEPHEVIVVDDRPAQAVDAPAPAPDVRVRTVVSGASGPAAARAAGTHAATGEIVLLLDDDVVPRPGLVAGHAARHAGRRGLVVVGAMPVDREREDAGGCWYTRELYARDYERRVAAYRRDAGDVLAHLWGGNVSLRRADAERVGIASPAFSLRRHEDREWGLRLHEAGLRGVFAAELRADHRYARSPERFFADAREQAQALALLHRLHPQAEPTVGTAAFLAGLPPGLRGMVGLARRPLGARALRAVLGFGLRTAQRAGVRGAQLRIAQVLRRVEQIDGARQAQAG